MDTLVKPTVPAANINPGRSVYRPAGAPKVVQKPKQVNVGGFGTQQSNKRQLGTSFEQAPKAEVDNRIEKQLAMLQQQIMQLTPAKAAPAPATKPALSLVQLGVFFLQRQSTFQNLEMILIFGEVT